MRWRASARLPASSAVTISDARRTTGAHRGRLVQRGHQRRVRRQVAQHVAQHAMAHACRPGRHESRPARRRASRRRRPRSRCSSSAMCSAQRAHDRLQGLPAGRSSIAADRMPASTMRRAENASRACIERGLDDIPAAARAHFDETARLQLHQRLANQGAADAEQVGQLLLAQALARRQLLRQDGFDHAARRFLIGWPWRRL